MENGELSDDEVAARDRAYADYLSSVADRLPERLNVRFLLWPEGQIAVSCGHARIERYAIEDTTRTDHRNEVAVLA